MMRRIRVLFLTLLLSFPTWSAAGASPPPFFSEGQYDPSISTPESVLGYPIGAYHTDYRGLERYLETVSQQSGRVVLGTYGRSYERRPLYFLIITTEENSDRLEAFRESIGRLADPRRLSSSRDAEEIIESTPVVAWMNYANDGNETAAFETGIQLTYQLAAGTDDVTKNILENVITIITPAHNPDSHERHVAWYNSFFVGPHGAPDPQAFEHHPPWALSTNFNHFQIDLNRDASFVTQQETEAIVSLTVKWHPQVFVDHHGETKSYFFPPFREPINPSIPQSVRRWLAVFGRANAEAFDRFGWSYFVGEQFDDFYPGYWDSWPTLQGAIGMTYETDGGGTMGLRMEREDGSIITLEDGIRHHFIASMATLETAANHRMELLSDFYSNRQAAIRGGRGPVYILPPGEISDELVRTLMKQGIEVQKSDRAFTLRNANSYLGVKPESRSFAQGSYIITSDQPTRALVQALLEPDIDLDETFLHRAAQQKKQNKSQGFYDITAWSLPIAHGADAVRSVRMPKVQTHLLRNPPERERLAPKKASYAYLISNTDNRWSEAAFLLLREGYRVASATKRFAVGGRSYPPGSLVLRVERNPDALFEAVTRLATNHGIQVFSTDTAWTDEGPSLGSNFVVDLLKPTIALVGGAPTSPTSYGSYWFLLERVYEYPFTPLAFEAIPETRLDRYTVLILPDGKEYHEAASRGLKRKLHGWVERGGTLIGIKRGAAFLTKSRSGLARSTLGSQLDGKGKEEKEKASKSEVIPGSFLWARTKADHPFTLGYPSRIPVFVYSSLVIQPPADDGVVTFQDHDLLLSGFAWDSSLERLRGSAYLIEEKLGEGRIVLFADDPNFRLFLHGLRRLFASCLLFAGSEIPDVF